MMKLSKWTIGVMSLVAACSTGSIGGDDASSNGVGHGSGEGSRDASAHPEAVAVDFYDGAGVSAACSGTLIAPNVVLTAAHCAEHSTSARVTAPLAKGQTTSVATIHTYDWVLGAADHHATHDLALLVLRDPIDVSSYASVDKTPCAGCKVEHIGRAGDSMAMSAPMRTSKTAPYARPYDWFLTHGSDDAGGPVVVQGTKRLVGLEVGRGQQTGGGYVVRLDEPRVRQWLSLNLESKDLKKYHKGPHGKLVGPVLGGQHFPGPPPDDSSVTADAATTDTSAATDAATTDTATTDAATTDTVTADAATTDTSTTSGDTGAGGDTSTSDTGAGGTSGDTGAGGETSTPDPSGAGGGGDDIPPDPPGTGEEVAQGGAPDTMDGAPAPAPEPYDPKKIDVLNPDGTELVEHHSPGYWGTSSTNPDQQPIDDQLVATEKANAEQMQDKAYVIGTHGYPNQMEQYPDEQAQMEMQQAAADGKTIVMSVCYGGMASETQDSSASNLADDLMIPKDQIVGCTGNVSPNAGSFDCDGQWVDGNGDPPKSSDINGVQLRNCAKDINGALQCP